MNEVAVAAMTVLSATVLPTGGGIHVREISCFSDHSILARAERGRIVIWTGSNWQNSSFDADATRLLRSPDARIFIVDSDSIVQEIRHGAATSTHWQLPRQLPAPLLAFMNGIIAVTPQRIFRLEPGGNATDLGETPAGPGRLRLNRAPVLIDDKGRLIACYGTSVREDDDMQGECMAPPPNGYHYLVDFGEPLRALGESSHFLAPFACGEAIVSVRRGVTQARDLTTGALLGRVAGAARAGSGCLDGRRPVLVGKSDIRVVDVPRLSRVWRKALAGSIETAAVCGAKVAAILEKRADPVMVDLPPAVATKLPRTRQTVVPAR